MEIHNIKEWCTALDETSTYVDKYEKQLIKFYKKMKVVPDYSTPFTTGCYKKEKFSLGLIKHIPIIALISAVFTGIVFAILFFSKINMVSTIILTVLTLIAVSAVQCGIKIIDYKLIIKKLAKFELDLDGFMRTVPINYRASDKMKTIALVYFTKPSIDPGIILDCVDDYLSKVNRTSIFHSVMFDLPCDCPFLSINDDDTISNNSQYVNTSNMTKKTNPFLPKDIDSKIFEGSKDSDKDLSEMIGLDGVKDQIQKFRNRISFYGNGSNNGCHMAFMGSAGTGKTTVARIVTKMLFDLGYIKNNQYIEISGDYLCAGDTSRASAIIEYAYGGVLFIDEAYLMYKPGGSDVIGVLLKAMEDHRQDFVCILAGYEEQMTKLFASNEGFNSRVKHTIYFADYNENEMLEIFNYFIRDYNGSHYKLDEGAKQLLLDTFTIEKKSKSFGNARTVRNAVDTIMDYYADRSIREHSNTRIIMFDDVQLYSEDRKRAIQHEMKNASAANQLDEQIIRLSELKPRMKNGSETPDEDMNRLIGLESFKNEIDILRNQKEFYNQIIHQKILLVGEESCGKTTLTRILTGYLYQLGYIQENKYLEIPAELLKGSYVGHTAKRAEAIISYASGGVLYIKNYNRLMESNDSFSSEALSALTTAINDNTDVTIVLADSPSMYIDSIKNLFTFVYNFPTYTNEQLLQIFDIQAMYQNFMVEEQARQTLYNYIIQNNLSIRDIQQIFTLTVKQHISTYDGNEYTKFIILNKDLVFPQTYVDPQITTFNNAMQNLQNNPIEISISQPSDQPTTNSKPSIKLNIKPKQ